MGRPGASTSSDPAAAHTPGEYRLRDDIRLAGSVLVSLRPLTATRLNDSAAAVVRALGGTFRSPAAVARDVGGSADAEDVDADGQTGASVDADDVATLLDGLHDRGYLEWRPARDPDHRPPVSVVVTVRNDRDALAGCLDALAALSYPDYEVLVVDDGSTDGTREAAATHALAAAGRLRVVEVGDPDDPLGIGASRNRGVRAAAHDVVAFTDADCRPRADWLADLVPCLAAHDLVGGRIRPAGEDAASVYEGINSSLDMGPRAARIDPGGEAPYLATANLVGRRAVFEAVPFPDRNVAEDVAVCWGALEAGFDVVYTPRGVVEHDYRSDLAAFAARRATYGASEALLAAERGRGQGGSVPVSTVALSLAVVALVALAAPALSTAAAALVAVPLGLLAAVRGAGLWRRLRRLSPAVGVRDVAESWGRGRLSGAYAVARETTRYYAVGLVLLGGATVAVGVLGEVPGARRVGFGVLTATLVAVVLPLAVEYRIHDPDVSLAGYARYYLADHLGYQRGVYRGALAHRTVAHLDPRGRFRLAGPGSRGVRTVSSRLLGSRTGPDASNSAP